MTVPELDEEETTGGITVPSVKDGTMALSSCRLMISSRASSNHEACAKEEMARNASKVVCGRDNIASMSFNVFAGRRRERNKTGRVLSGGKVP